MCGRFQIAWPWREMVKKYGIEHGKPIPPNWETCIPRFNVCPTYLVPVVRQTDGAREAVAMRWGYPAMWLRGRGGNPWSRSLVNCKADDAASKRTWKKSLAERRCLVPATGFYEWARDGKTRYPLLFARSDEVPLAFAGIWGSFDKDGERVERFSIITAGPSPELAPYHDRGPVILEPEAWDDWLDPGRTAIDDLRPMMGDVPAGLLVATEVSTKLNSIKNTGADLMVADWSRADLPG